MKIEFPARTSSITRRQFLYYSALAASAAALGASKTPPRKLGSGDKLRIAAVGGRIIQGGRKKVWRYLFLQLVHACFRRFHIRVFLLISGGDLFMLTSSGGVSGLSLTCPTP